MIKLIIFRTNKTEFEKQTTFFVYLHIYTLNFLLSFIFKQHISLAHAYMSSLTMLLCSAHKYFQYTLAFSVYQALCQYISMLPTKFWATLFVYFPFHTHLFLASNEKLLLWFLLAFVLARRFCAHIHTHMHMHKRLYSRGTIHKFIVVGSRQATAAYTQYMQYHMV